MGIRKQSDDKIADACGQAVEKIITRLVMGEKLEVVVSEAGARIWGFPDVEAMRLTLEQLPDALPDTLRPLLIIKGL